MFEIRYCMRDEVARKTVVMTKTFEGKADINEVADIVTVYPFTVEKEHLRKFVLFCQEEWSGLDDEYYYHYCAPNYEDIDEYEPEKYWYTYNEDGDIVKVNKRILQLERELLFLKSCEKLK